MGDKIRQDYLQPSLFSLVGTRESPQVSVAPVDEKKENFEKSKCKFSIGARMFLCRRISETDRSTSLGLR